MVLELPNTGMAVTINIGDIYDIYPRNKRDVVNGMSLNANFMGCSQNIGYSGPTYELAGFQGGKAIISFSHVGSEPNI